MTDIDRAIVEGRLRFYADLKAAEPHLTMDEIAERRRQAVRDGRLPPLKSEWAPAALNWKSI